MRHAAASLWSEAGVDIKTVSAWPGHSTAKLTRDTYGRLLGTDADPSTLDRVNRGLTALSGTTCTLVGCPRADLNCRHPL